MTYLEVDGLKYPCDQVIRALEAQVTASRLAKINQVIDHRDSRLVTVMENIYDNGNTSAVMRSAEAFGFHHFHQIIGIDKFKESKRVTQGADKWLVKKKWKKTKDCIDHLKESGHKIYVTHLEGGKPIGEVDFHQKVALCFGSEKEGASPELTQIADEKVFIPMQGFVQSFNISVAAALCFQHIHYEHKKLKPFALADKERQYLLALYLYRSCGKPPLKTLLSKE